VKRDAPRVRTDGGEKRGAAWTRLAELGKRDAEVSDVHAANRAVRARARPPLDVNSLGRSYSFDEVVNVLAVAPLEVAVAQQALQPPPQRKAKFRGSCESFADRTAKVRDGKAADVGMQQIAGIGMRQSVDGDSADGYDRDVAISTYEAAARIVPAVRSEHDSRIEIVAFAGRSLDAKRARYQVLVANLSALGVWAALKCRQEFGASRIEMMWRQGRRPPSWGFFGFANQSGYAAAWKGNL
jgi:hypothetical protein